PWRGPKPPAVTRWSVHRGGSLIGAARLVVVPQRDSLLTDRAQDAQPTTAVYLTDHFRGKRQATVRATVLTFPGDGPWRGPALKVRVHEALELLPGVVGYPVVPDQQFGLALDLEFQGDGARPFLRGESTRRPPGGPPP